MEKEQLEKSIDSLIEEFFTENSAPAQATEETTTPAPAVEEVVAKAEVPGSPEPKESAQMKDGSSAKSDEKNANDVKAPKAKKDEGNGRPEEVSDVPDVDEDGKRAKGYEAIQKPNSATPDVSAKGTVVKADTIEISKEDYELLQKAKKDREEESLRKARQEQTDLIKSAVTEAVTTATEGLRKENQELKKSLEEQSTLVKAIAKKPQPRKSISTVQAMEKSFAPAQPEGGPQEPKAFSKSEMMDVAEELVKAKKLTVEQAIELEDTGYIFDKEARQVFERELKKRA